MKYQPIPTLCTASLLVFGTPSLSADEGAAPQWRDLFNGKDLAGWTDVNTSPETWTVREGLLVCSGKPVGVMRSDRQYENFILHIEWRHMKPGGNSGIFVWSEGRPAGKGCLPKGMEVQMLELDWVNRHKKKDGTPNHPGRGLTRRAEALPMGCRNAQSSAYSSSAHSFSGLENPLSFAMRPSKLFSNRVKSAASPLSPPSGGLRRRTEGLENEAEIADRPFVPVTQGHRGRSCKCRISG